MGVERYRWSQSLRLQIHFQCLLGLHEVSAVPPCCARTPLDFLGFHPCKGSMALVSSSVLKSPKFLCKYVRISPSSTVVCYVHSQLAVQPYNVRKQRNYCVIYLLFVRHPYNVHAPLNVTFGIAGFLQTTCTVLRLTPIQIRSNISILIFLVNIFMHRSMSFTALARCSCDRHISSLQLYLCQ